MNYWIRHVEVLPFSLWTGLQISISQVCLLFGIIVMAKLFLMYHSVRFLKWALCMCFAFFTLRTISFIRCRNQKWMIIYNIPKKQAIDFIAGRNCYYTGDPGIQTDESARNFYLQPARILYRGSMLQNLPDLPRTGIICFAGKKILFANSDFVIADKFKPDTCDLLVISGRSHFNLVKFNTSLPSRQIITDGTVSVKAALYWKKKADSLRIPIHDINRDGAFVMTLN